MTRGSREWVVRALRDWALDVRHGMALVTYQSVEARDAILTELAAAFRNFGRTSSTLRCTSRTGPVQFLAEVAAEHADILSVFDPDRMLFGENQDHAPFWINFNREPLTGHPGVQIWWMSPPGAIRFGQQLPDLARFFLFREELNGAPDPTPSEPVQPFIEDRDGSQERAADLLERALRAGRSPKADPARVWIELGLPAVDELLILRESDCAVAAFQELASLVGSPLAQLEHARQLSNGEDFTMLGEVARGFLVVARVFARLERNEEARGSAEEAVQIYRPLAERRPNTYYPNLASSLHFLDVCTQGSRAQGSR